MANGILCTNDFILASATTFSHSTEVTGYPAENVQIYQPGESYRTSALGPGSIFAENINRSIDVVACLYTNVTPHTNLCQQSNELDTTWTTTNLGVVQDTSNSALPGAAHGWSLTDNATAGNHSLFQDTASWVPDGLTTSFESKTWTASAYVSDGGSSLDCRLRMEAGTGHYVECSFDLGAGTAGTPSETGSVWGTPTATITSLTTLLGAHTWYRVTVTAEATGASSEGPSARLLLESGGNISYSGGSNSIKAQGLMVENAATAGTWVANTTDTGAFWKLDEGVGATELFLNVPCVSGDLSTWPYVHLVRKFSESACGTAEVYIHDPNNLDGYIEMGNLIVAKSFQPTYNIDNDWTLGWAEEGGSDRSPGGQLYRPVNKRYRRLSMRHSWLTEAEAYEEAFEIDRRVGRSEGVLAVVDPDSEYAHKWTLWGLQDTTNDILSRRYVTGLQSRVYAKEWAIIEALP